MRLTFYGHSCFEADLGGKKILFDPFISPNPAASHIDVDAIEADYILLSHGHGDHVADAEDIAKRTGARIISNFEIVSWYTDKGLENVHPLNHGGSVNLDFGRVKYVNAVHSSVLPDGTYGGNPGGFVIETDETTFYYAGDTALTLDMKLIAEEFNLNCALLPIGDNFTMGIDDAIRCSDFINCNNIIGMHYNTFPPIQINTDEAIAKFGEAGKKLSLLDIGETIEIENHG